MSHQNDDVQLLRMNSVHFRIYMTLIVLFNFLNLLFGHIAYISMAPYNSDLSQNNLINLEDSLKQREEYLVRKSTNSIPA